MEFGAGPSGSMIDDMETGEGFVSELKHFFALLTDTVFRSALTNGMLFGIFIGATVFSLIFRALGGDDIVIELVEALGLGSWCLLFLIMGIVFFLGFFFDWIEITLIVLPVFSPIISGLDFGDHVDKFEVVYWFAILMAVNLQTSFLTPPFGFALFYLRGVAPAAVKTTHIYKGAFAFIALQLVGLAITGYIPSLVNYLPFSSYLTSDNAPPPINPRLQACMREDVFEYYDGNKNELLSAIRAAQSLNLESLPENLRESLNEGFATAQTTFDRVADVRSAQAALSAFEDEYRPIHTTVRGLQNDMRVLRSRIEALEQDASRNRRSDEPNEDLNTQLEQKISELESQRDDLESSIPQAWQAANDKYKKLMQGLNKAVRDYEGTVDGAYEKIPQLLTLLAQTEALEAMEGDFAEFETVVKSGTEEQAEALIKEGNVKLGELDGVSKIKSQINKAAKAMKPGSANPEQALERIAEGKALLDEELAWRKRAVTELQAGIQTYDEAIRHSIGLRLQEKLPEAQAKSIAMCQSVHRDISLNF
ncbi:MAG: TRAP transporter large permease subunit, partial [Gammaproteobacteria bacterium]|nr:TRAP transporter large permease subunit [Gammaproteobacteria bacterium]